MSTEICRVIFFSGFIWLFSIQLGFSAKRTTSTACSRNLEDPGRIRSILLAHRNFFSKELVALSRQNSSMIPSEEMLTAILTDRALSQLDVAAENDRVDLIVSSADIPTRVFPGDILTPRALIAHMLEFGVDFFKNQLEGVTPFAGDRVSGKDFLDGKKFYWGAKYHFRIIISPRQFARLLYQHNFSLLNDPAKKKFPADRLGFFKVRLSGE